MGKLQSEKIFILTNNIPNGHKKQEAPPEAPPQIPPRMKNKGPALPEKPPHIRAKSNTTTLPSQPAREPLKPRVLNLDKSPSTQREVLVAASKAGRERPVEKRQREPAKLLMPTSGSSKKDLVIPTIHLDESAPKKDQSVVPSKGSIRQEDCMKKEIAIIAPKNPLWVHDESVPIKKSDQKTTMVRKSRPIQPVLLIPRNLLTWGSTPISYALWTQRDVGRGVVKPVKQAQVRQSKSETSGTSAVRMRSGSVTRSGSLTSQGSSSSDSGGETFPKSVLKKQKRTSTNTTTSKGSSNRRVEQKKNVTFNAFATVQLMEE